MCIRRDDCVRIYIFTHVHVYVCIHIYIYTYISEHVTCLVEQTRDLTWMKTPLLVYAHVYMCVCAHTYAHMCVRACIHIYTHLHRVDLHTCRFENTFVTTGSQSHGRSKLAAPDNASAAYARL